ncbi:MAG: EI24 domain-containing protein [Candidatus Sumerlaeia bacterium]
MDNTASGFFRGVGDIWRGAGLLLGRPGLWLWVLIPFAINIAVFGLLAWAGWHYASQVITHYTGDGFWWNILHWIMNVLVWLFLGALVIFLFVPIGSLIALPFNDVLSEKVEIILTGASVDESFSLKALTRAMVVGAHTSIKLTLKTLALLVPVMLLYLFPGGAPVAAILSALITIRFLSLEFTSYSMDRRYYDYRRRAEFLQKNRARTFGLGTMAWLIMLVPVLNALFIPVSAVAGTILFCETELAPAFSNKHLPPRGR